MSLYVERARNQTNLRWFPLAVLAVVFAGCGSPRTASVSGRVTRADGTPVVGARVVARCDESGVTVSGTTDSDGKYILSTVTNEGAPFGEYGVMVLEDRGNWDDPKPMNLDPKYRDASTSGLILMVQSGGSVTYDLTLDPLRKR